MLCHYNSKFRSRSKMFEMYCRNEAIYDAPDLCSLRDWHMSQHPNVTYELFVEMYVSDQGGFSKE